MYGLKQAALLAYEFLSTLLKDAGYTPLVGTLGLWKHKSRKTIFCLCVDDFGVKYYSKEDILHLQDTISKQYTCKIDWSGSNFLGFTLKWNYEAGYVDESGTIPFSEGKSWSLSGNVTDGPEYGFS